MTYEEYYEILYNNYAESSEKYLKLEKELATTKGFGDFNSMPDYTSAQINWQIATNNYWRFLSFIKGKEINPNDQYILH